MVTYDVSLQLVSPVGLKDDDFFKITNIDVSHIRKKEKNNKIYWIVEVDDEYTSLEQGLSDLISCIEKYNIPKSLNNFKLYLRIGVFYDTITSTTILNNSILLKIINVLPEINIDIISYPCSESEEE